MASLAYGKYSDQYRTMGNSLPNWNAISDQGRSPRKKKPWYPSDMQARILDLGCGWGHQLCVLWSHGYRALEGVDISESMVRNALIGIENRFPVHCSDGIDFLNTRIGHYDLIICNDVIEHIALDSLDEFAERLFNSLRPGGRVVIRTPNMACLGASFSRYMDLTHLRGFTEFSLRQLAHDHGFEKIEFLPDSFIDRDPWKITRWRPWRPFRGAFVKTRTKALLNTILHEFVYLIRDQQPRPTRFSYNIEMYGQRP